MKILVVIPYYVPAFSYGGPVKVAHDLNKEFVKKGHQVTVVTTDVHSAKNRNPIRAETIDGVKIMRFRNFSNYLAKNFNAYLPFGFKKWLQKNLKNYDIVHCHDFFTYQNIVTSQSCKKYNLPFVIQPHGCLDSVRIESKSSKLKSLFLKFFQSVLINSKAIIALTEHEKKSIDTLQKVSFEGETEGVKTATKSSPPLPLQGNFNLKDKIHIIPNGINLNEFQKIEKINLYKKYNLPPKTKLLFYFGRVQYIKGIDFVIKTFAKIPLEGDTEGVRSQTKQQPPNPLAKGDKKDNSQHLTPNSKHFYHLFIIGPNENNEQARLEKLSKELNLEKNITFVGQLNGAEKNSFLASCDLYLFFSRGEGLPMTILEVAALGVPSVISQECYIPEIAQANGGYEVDKANFEANAKLIQKHFEDENKIEEMRKNSQKVIQEKFELAVVVEKMLELYRK